MALFYLPLLVATISQTTMVASQPLDLAPRANNLCSSGDVEYTDTVKDMFKVWTTRYCRDMKPDEHEDWLTGFFTVKFSSSADGCNAPSSMPENECKDHFQKILDDCSIGAKISGGESLWTGEDGSCLKFSIDAEKREKLSTDVEFHPEVNEVDLGEGLYSCKSYMKLFDKAKGDCLSVGCDVNKKACDSHACVTIDGTTNQGVDEKFKDYLAQLRDVIAGSCKEKEYVDYFCTPNGICSNNKRVKVEIPSFIGSSTSKDGDIFVANYKVTFSEKEKKSSCEHVTSLVSAGIGALPGGSLLGSTSLLC